MKKKYLFFVLCFCAFFTIFYYRTSFQYFTEPLAKGQGVVFYDRWRAQPGYILVEIYSIPWGRPRCRIMDLNGEVVLTLPGINCELLSDGGYISNIDRVLTRYDRNLNIQWSIPDVTVRHDIYENLDNKEVLLWADVEMKVLESMPFANTKQYLGKTLLANELRGYSFEGQLNYRWNAYEHLEDLQTIKNKRDVPLFLTLEYMDRYEFSHFNSLDVIPQNSYEKKNPAFKKGNILTSSTTCGCLAIIDRETGKIVWFYRTPKAQGVRTAHPDNYRTHSAHWLKNDNILFYVNSRDDDAEHDLFSEAVEINPLTLQKVWSYKTKSSGRFWGNYLGSSYRLENGNTLLTSLANGGNIFEVNRKGRLVWEWSNGSKNPLFPGSVYRARRISEQQLSSLRSAAQKKYENSLSDPFFEP